jgi:hypothetical protein
LWAALSSITSADEVEALGVTSLALKFQVD